VVDRSALVVTSERVVLPGGIGPASIEIDHGRITAIHHPSAIEHSSGARAIDAGRLVVLPGLVDTHVHINDPGRADWEGFEHATRAAAAGGVTTLVDMPLNSIPPTTTAGGLDAKRRAARGRCHVDVGFWGGVVPGNRDELTPLALAGGLGYKCFLCPSGVPEFEHVGERDLRAAMPVLAALGLPLLAHAELPSLLRVPDGDPRRYSTWLASRPPEGELAAIALLTRLAREFNVRVHIVHLAAATALPTIALARAEGVPLTVETCPHYLTFAADEIADGATAFKCAPPLRPGEHREGLWQGLIHGEIDLVATDHSPSPPDLKHLDDGDFVHAWGGIASLQLGLAAVWRAAKSRRIGIDRLAEWMAAAPARLAGLDRMKGRIAIGHDADLVIWDPDSETAVDAAALYHRHPVTPYAGRTLAGRVHTTILRGDVVFENGACTPVPRGRVIGRPVV
jgi:allantoinase